MSLSIQTRIAQLKVRYGHPSGLCRVCGATLNFSALRPTCTKANTHSGSDCSGLSPEQHNRVCSSGKHFDADIHQFCTLTESALCGQKSVVPKLLKLALDLQLRDIDTPRFDRDVFELTQMVSVGFSG